VLEVASRISDFGIGISEKGVFLPKPASEIRNHKSEIIHLNCRGTFLNLSSPRVMGIINVTPDSFSDGGKFNSVEKALPQAEKMLKEGAAMLDIGGYSSRPGAVDIPVEEEMRRLAPVVEGIIRRFPEAILSIDTFRAPVAKAMLERGAHIINDIGAGLLDPAMPATVAAFGAPYCIMHMQGTPQTMQKHPRYDHVVQEVWQFLVERVHAARAAGVKDIIIDPGFGFGKTVAHNYALLREVAVFGNMDLPVLVGLSRKSMLYKPFAAGPEEVLDLSGAAHLHALQQGVHILRVHDVAEAVRIVGMFALLQGNGAV
ncbi:MAG: dihydropteroate synthase, partial [Bacteroidia bacterium]